jgi:uncharacterized protein (DUF1800 family)
MASLAEIGLARHVLDRLGYGPGPGDLDMVIEIGIDRWIEQQLSPESLPVPESLSAIVAALDTLRMSPAELFAQYGPPSFRPPGGGAADPDARKAAQIRARIIPEQAAERRLFGAILNPRQLRESLVDFWFNHFNVFAGKGLDRLWVGAYQEQAIRPFVLGRFKDLLRATAKHPAMLFYLDNWQNIAPGTGPKGDGGINENYAREVMELHTLGVDGGYTQGDVTALARILTGWTLGPPHPGERGRQGFVFAANRHDSGSKALLGRTFKDNGIAEGEAALDLLAAHPATARHISFQLAQYFLADDPDPPVVRAMTEMFLSSKGDIQRVLAVLFSSAAFRAPRAFGAKFKTPMRYVASMARASGLTIRNVKPLRNMLAQLGQPLYGCQTPDGYKNTEAAWLGPDSIVRRISLAVALSSGRLPLDREMSDASPAALAMSDPPELSNPLDSEAVLKTLGADLFSDTTRESVAKAPDPLKAAIVLGSPEFMRC